LNTHFLFASAAAAFLVGKPEAIVLAGVGAVLPDLDRPYWFIPKKGVAEEEYHRALFHNVVALALTYLFNPYIGLGLFSHLLLDSMTTVKDRGVEWLFPFTRIISRDYWSQAEVQEEPLAWVPWRRTYGPALNGHMLDTYVSLCSLGVIISWTVLQNYHFCIFDLSYWLNSGLLTLVGIVTLLFASGEYIGGWSSWSVFKKIGAMTILVLILVGLAHLGLTSQNAFFSWKDIPNDSLLEVNDLFSRIFVLSAVVYPLILLKCIRGISIALSERLPFLCTKVPSRDFFIKTKQNEPDVFV
jgi:hypothetical protein